MRLDTTRHIRLFVLEAAGHIVIYDDMKITATMPEATLVAELGERAQQHRVGMNLTQAQLADAAGVSVRTIECLEAGQSIQFDNLVRILRALRLAENLDQLIPETSVRPIQLAGATSTGRKRASTRKNPRQPGKPGWVWGDEK